MCVLLMVLVVSESFVVNGMFVCKIIEKFWLYFESNDCLIMLFMIGNFSLNLFYLSCLLVELMYCLIVKIFFIIIIISSY